MERNDFGSKVGGVKLVVVTKRCGNGLDDIDGWSSQKWQNLEKEKKKEPSGRRKMKRREEPMNENLP